MTTWSLDIELNTLPHYTDEQFRHAQTVFGKEEDGLEYVYSDRLAGWDYSAHERGVIAANESGAGKRTARWYQAYLSAYWERPIEIKHILAGWNWATGYPYQVFGYKNVETKDSDQGGKEKDG